MRPESCCCAQGTKIWTGARPLFHNQPARNPVLDTLVAAVSVALGHLVVVVVWVGLSAPHRPMVLSHRTVRSDVTGWSCRSTRRQQRSADRSHRSIQRRPSWVFLSSTLVPKIQGPRRMMRSARFDPAAPPRPELRHGSTDNPKNEERPLDHGRISRNMSGGDRCVRWLHSNGGR